jgi:hypothetical protein
MTSPEQHVAWLADRAMSIHEIKQLAYRFARAHDSRDLDEMKRIFVQSEAPLPFPDFNLANVLAVLPEYFKVAGPTILFVTNHVIEIDSAEAASGSVYCLAKLDIDGTWVEQAILYEDAYRRDDGTWRFVRRRHLLWYGIELPERPFDQPKTQWPVTATGRGSLPEDFAAWRSFYGISESPTGFYAQPAAPHP